MPQLSTLRLLLSSSPSLAFNPLSRFNRALLLKPRSPLTALAHADGRPRRRGGGGKGGGFQTRRGSSTQRKEEMAAAEGMGFNKRRAEGRDKGDKPKTLQLKTRKLNPVNTICYVQILGTGMDTQDTSPSVLLFFDKQRFIFNAGEGLQRFCTEHKIKLSKIDHMFLTRVCSETGGGLPGLLLTLAGIGEEGMSVNIWGPSDLNYLVDAMKSFIPNAAMIHTHSFGEIQNGKGVTSSDSQVGSCPDPVILIDDEVVRISAIPLKPRYSKGMGEANGDSGVCELNTLGREERSPFSNPLTQYSEDLQRETGSRLKPGDISVIYACELSEIKGKFDRNKAASLGLKPGPKYRELQLGNSVVSDHLDITVHPSDVLGPSIPGPVVLIVDCPTQFHMLELFSVQSLNCYYADTLDHPKESLKSVNCIIHLGPSSVTKNVDYQNWMKRFGRAQHIMAGHEISNMEIPILKSSARIAARLNYLCPQFFPARGFSSPHHPNNFSEGVSGSCEDTSTNCESISAENLLKFHLRPYTQLGLDKTVIPTRLSHSEIVKELLAEIPEIDDVTQHVNQFWQSPKDGRLTMPPNDNHVIMVEEPWISDSSCIPNANLGREGPHASREDTSSAAGSQKDKVGWNSDIPACLENITREDMEIILLGTGSSQPSKYRNVSSIYINLFSKGSLLLDCGEGTLAQLKRRFGVKGADDAVKSLRCIWISHIHADHHTGLARILALRCHLLKGVPHEPLLVIGPRQLKRFLDAYSRLEDLNMQFLDCRHTTEDALQSFLDSHDSGGNSSPEHGNKSNNGARKVENTTSHHLKNTFFTQGTRMQNYWKMPGSPIDTGMALPVLTKMKEVLHEAGLEALYSVPVVHCPQAFGIVLKAAERINRIGKTIPGWKLVYSGDTRPCQALIDASRDATVLIHEATFEDGMGDEAISRNHSTTMEAIKVGTAADAYRIILTHFSQRYPKIPVFDESHMHKTCIAFDLMSINVADLPVLPKVLPYLKVLFRNEMVVDESVGESDEVMNSTVY